MSSTFNRKNVISLSIDEQQRGTFSYVLNFHFSAHFCPRFLCVSSLCQVAQTQIAQLKIFIFQSYIQSFLSEKFLLFPSPPETSYFLMIKFICVQSKTRRVSVPSGDFLFSNKAYEIAKETGDLFPSPPGTSYFLIAFEEDRIAQKKFPSPLGTFYFLIFTGADSVRKKLGFPSPLGTFYFLIARTRFFTRTVTISVPSGDFLFFNKAAYEEQCEQGFGFRPLWGLLIF